jgi:hypothetical protein
MKRSEIRGDFEASNLFQITLRYIWAAPINAAKRTRFGADD